jgi:hypothetical protein
LADQARALARARYDWSMVGEKAGRAVAEAIETQRAGGHLRESASR